MNIKLLTLATAFGTFGCIASIGMAADIFSPDDQVLVLKEFDRLHIEAPVAPDLAVMNVRVFSPDNELLLSTRTMGESVEFLVNNDLPDGVYRYEAVSIFGNIDLSSRANYVDGEKTLKRKFGTFRVSNGLISEDIDLNVPDDVSLLDQVIKRAINLAGVTIDFFISSAQAADLSTTPDGDVIIEDDSASLIFEYGANTGTDDGVWTWWLTAYQNGTFQPDFRVYDAVHGLDVLTLDMGTGNANSINVDPDGDIHWAASGLNFDRGSSALSIGTSAVRADLTISSADPSIDLYNEGLFDSMGIDYDGFDFNIVNSSGADTVAVRWNAPADSLRIDGSGNVGIGTGSPSSNLNVVAGNDALIRVDNTTVSPPSGDQAMFRLQSAAPNKVRFLIGNTGGLWTFDNAGTSFQINKAGTGVNEFRVESDGDIHVLGSSYALTHVNTSSRDSKTDFAPIDEIAVLEKLSELPMSTWRYKVETEDERHLGPIAEDFQQAFGLSDGKSISTVDASGVALTAIKGLNIVMQERTAEIVELTKSNSELQEMNSDLISANQALDERLTRLENVLFRQNEIAVR